MHKLKMKLKLGLWAFYTIYAGKGPGLSLQFLGPAWAGV